jgi:hypothetical protein
MRAPRFQSRLINRLSWFNVLPLLGCDITTTSLPATVKCPVCQEHGCKVLTIAPGKGEWVCCPSCHTSGDLISLAARGWQTERRMAATGLVDHFGLSEVSSSELDRDSQWHEFQESIQSLWKNCRKPGPSTSGDLRWAARLLGLNRSSAEVWHAGAGKLAGVVSKEEVREHLPGFGALSRRWEEAVVVALHSLPGKISSFLTFLRSVGEDSTVFYQVADPSGLRLGGFLGLEAVTGPDHPDFGNKVLLMNDPLLALRLHERHLAREKPLLPVAGFRHEDATNLNVGNGLFAGKRVYVWSPAITKELLLVAKEVDGWIVTDEDRDGGYWDDMNRVGLPVWVGRKLRFGRPWPDVLATCLQSKYGNEYADLLRHMQLSEQERDRLLTCCRPSDREKLRDFEHNRSPRAAAVSPKKRIREENGCWYLLDVRKNGSTSLQLSDAILRIDTIVRFARSRKRLYEGRILYRGHEVPFSVAAGKRHEFQTHTAKWMRAKLIDAGLGVLQTVPGKYQRLLDVALYLHEPGIVTGRDRCGWDKDENAFIFDGFSISARGEVKTGISVYASMIPGRDLHPPQDLTWEQIVILSGAGPLSSLVWSVTACVMANLLAPLFNRTTTGVALLGDGAAFVGPMIAKRLGCVQVRYSPAHEAQHGWPIVLPAVKEHLLTKQLAVTGPHNCVVVTSRQAAAVLGIESGWNWVTCEDPLTSLDKYGEVLPLIVPAYLVWLAQQGFHLPESDSYAKSVLCSLGDWVKSLHGNADHLENSTTFLSPDQPEGCRDKVVAQRFVELLCRMLEDGYLGIGVNIALGMVVAGDNVFLPKKEIYRALAKRKLPPFDSAVVTRALYHEQVLLGEEYVDGIPVWSLDPVWWKKTYEPWTKRKTSKFRR